MGSQGADFLKESNTKGCGPSPPTGSTTSSCRPHHLSIYTFLQPSCKSRLGLINEFHLTMSAPVVDIASAIQSTSIKHHPDPAHDLNPSTAASAKKPVSPTTSISSKADSIPESAVRPIPRRANLPPLPDMRFEQSYLASLQGAESWWSILWITGRDQVSPLPFRLPLRLLKRYAGYQLT